MFRSAPIALLCAALLSAIATVARADVLAEFDAASVAYREQRYSVAATSFEGVIATAAAADQAIVLEARKYLAACYLFLERPEDADGQFASILTLDPGYRVDPAVFPRDFVDRFENVRRRLEAERMAELEAQLAAARATIDEQNARIEIDRRLYRSLYEFSSESLIVHRNSRLLAAVPFGVGQFQNRNRRRGRWFAITESLALAGYVAGYVWNRRVASIAPDPMHQLEWDRQIRASLALNWSSGIAFAGLVVAGAVEAEANFVPTIESTRRREVPARLRPVESTESTEPAVSAQLHLSPFGAQFQLDF